jgi:hypothetical protein
MALPESENGGKFRTKSGDLHREGQMNRLSPFGEE